MLREHRRSRRKFAIASPSPPTTSLRRPSRVSEAFRRPEPGNWPSLGDPRSSTILGSAVPSGHAVALLEVFERGRQDAHESADAHDGDLALANPAMDLLSTGEIARGDLADGRRLCRSDAATSDLVASRPPAWPSERAST